MTTETKPLQTISTKSIMTELSMAEIQMYEIIFKALKALKPQENHFSVTYQSLNSGKGLSIWFITDEIDNCIMGTIMFPDEY